MDSTNHRITQLYARGRPTLTNKQQTNQTNNNSTKQSNKVTTEQTTHKAKTKQQQTNKQQRYPFFLLSHTPHGRSGPADRASVSGVIKW